MKLLSMLLAAIAVVLLFSACGQSGPLYIPGDPSRMSVPPEDPDNVQQSEEEEEDDSSQ